MNLEKYFNINFLPISKTGYQYFLEITSGPLLKDSIIVNISAVK